MAGINLVDSTGQDLLRNLPRVLRRMLNQRGFSTDDEIIDLLHPRLKNLTHPYQLNHLEKAVMRILDAIDRGQRICIYADFDLDGTSGAALLHRAFVLLGITEHFVYQPKRLSDGYGFHAHLVPEIIERGAKLIVTVDVGITAHEAVAEAQRLGVDVIITDHHLPEAKLPEAFAVVNPNTTECTSGLGHLCGAGVAFYLAMALKMELKRSSRLKSDVDLRELLDCLAIGTLTDMVPLVRENRVLVKHGLRALKNSQRPGLQALMQALELNGRDLSSQDVAIRFAPKLNALSRMEKELMPLDVFMANNMDSAQSMVTEILNCNDLRVNLQKQAEKLAFEIVRTQNPRGAIWVWSEQFHRGVVGLVATKLSQEFLVPAFVGSVQAGGQIVGSGRLNKGSTQSLLEILNGSSELFERFGGHRQACGFEIHQDRAQLFFEYLHTLPTVGSITSENASWKWDGELNLNDVTPQLMSWLEQLEPFGSGFEVPRFLLKSATLKSIRPLSEGKHYKFSLRDPLSGAGLDAIWFSPPIQHPVLKQGLTLGMSLEFLGELQWNYYNGQRTIQMLIVDARSPLN